MGIYGKIEIREVSFIFVSISATNGIFISEDYSKRLFQTTKLLLRLIFIWPGSDSILNQKLFYWFAIFCCLFVNGGMIAYFIHYMNDYRKCMNNISSMSTLFQVSLHYRILILVAHVESIIYPIHL